jgi:DNA-binding LacI/PurR family transcriptional regulator
MTSNNSKHTDIAHELRSEITSGKYGTEGRLPSEAQLVKRFGVSRPTTAQALRTLEQEGLVQRRAGSGTYVTLKNLRHTGLRQLGMIVPGLGRIEIFEVICGDLASLARVHEFGIHWGGSTQPGAGKDADMSIAEAEVLCSQFIEKGIRGVFFAPFEHTSENEAANRRITERLSHAGIPVILLDRDICAFPLRSGYDLVGIDNFAAGYTVAQHLIKLGARRIAFVSRPHSATTVDARRNGAASALRDHGLEVPRDFFQMGETADIKFIRQLTAAKRLDAVICTNDHTAAQLLQGLSRLNLQCPRDLRIGSFDDVRFATLLNVPLTTIHQPCRDIALVAFHAMRERIQDPTLPPRSLLLSSRLVVRESCGAYLSAANK